MALSRGSSNGADWRDVTGNLVAFEAINRVRLELRISTADHYGRADLAISILAHAVDSDLTEQPPLGSVQLTICSTRLRTLEAALIHGLYMLDGQLASGEYKKVLDG